MADWFLDYEGGNDANNGTSFAQRVKTFTRMNALAVAANDRIKIKKSMDWSSVGNATWTFGSRTVTLAAAKNKRAWSATTEGAMTVSANVTSALATGPNGVSSSTQVLTIASAFTTGKIAYDLIASGGTQDFSGYQGISFLFQTNAAIAANTIRISLCSDTTGDTPVDSFDLPAVTLTGWIPITLYKGSALGSNIQSVSITALLDPGAVAIQTSGITAVLAEASSDSLCYKSVIAKSGESPMMITHIDNAVVTLGIFLNSTAASATAKAYCGSTATVTTYHRRGIDTAVPTGSQVLNNVNITTGTSGNPVVISGGWDATAMTTQTGDTWINCHYEGVGFELNSNDYITFQNIGILRATRPLNWTASNRLGLTLDNFLTAGGASMLCPAVASTTTFAALNTVTLVCANASTTTHVLNGSSANLQVGNNFTGQINIIGTWGTISALGTAGTVGLSTSVYVTCTTFTGSAYGTSLIVLSTGVVFAIGILNLSHSPSGAATITSSGKLIIGTFNYTLTLSSNLTFSGGYVSIGTANLTDASASGLSSWCSISSNVDIGLLAVGAVAGFGVGPFISSGTMRVGRLTGLGTGTCPPFTWNNGGSGKFIVNSYEFIGTTAPTLTSFEYTNIEVFLGRYENNSNDFRHWLPGALGQGDIVNVESPAVMAWRYTLNSTIATSLNPVLIPSGSPLLQEGGSALTNTRRVNRITGSPTVELMLPANQVPGITSDVTHAASGTATWETLSVSGTPSAKGAVQPMIRMYGSNGDAVILGKMTAS